MKKKMIYVVAALVLGAVTVFNVKTVLEANHVYDLTKTSIDALSENSDGESGESGGSTGDGESDTGANITDERECHNKNGYWNMALICTDSGIEKLTCERTGELTLWGFTVFKVSYKKGEKYELAWERWACTTSTGNCCLSDKQGLRVR